MEAINGKPLEAAATPSVPSWEETAKKLTLLDLNNIRLDAKHTILTPDYLENLINQKPSVPGS